MPAPNRQDFNVHRPRRKPSGDFCIDAGLLFWGGKLSLIFSIRCQMVRFLFFVISLSQTSCVPSGRFRFVANVGGEQ